MKLPRIIVPALLAFFVVGLFTNTAPAQTEKVLYRFQNGDDGDFPSLPLVSDKAGNLYGVSSTGVFQLTPSGKDTWTETTIYTPGDAGVNHLVFDKAGNLFGTTFNGGQYNSGTVFELSPPAQKSGVWTSIVVYAFGDASNTGSNPTGLTIGPNGSLYGFAQNGGAYYCGVIFQLTPNKSNGTWTYAVHHNFLADPSYPYPVGSPVLDKNGNLYGETSRGGGSQNCQEGCGTVVELSPPAHKGGWRYSVVYAFQAGNDGGTPNGGLILDAAGNLYGTTTSGGANDGAVFELSPAQGGGWTETSLYTFNSADWGSYPSPGVVLDAAGNLYGTAGIPAGMLHRGVVFELTPSQPGNPWTETTVHEFGKAGDGRDPKAGLLIKKSGFLYGTTRYGGIKGGCGHFTSGCGTVFSLRP